MDDELKKQTANIIQGYIIDRLKDEGIEYHEGLVATTKDSRAVYFHEGSPDLVPVTPNVSFYNLMFPYDRERAGTEGGKFEFQLWTARVAKMTYETMIANFGRNAKYFFSASSVTMSEVTSASNPKNIAAYLLSYYVEYVGYIAVPLSVASAGNNSTKEETLKVNFQKETLTVSEAALGAVDAVNRYNGETYSNTVCRDYDSARRYGMTKTDAYSFVIYQHLMNVEEKKKSGSNQ
jgi:hypothetical protein